MEINQYAKNKNDLAFSLRENAVVKTQKVLNPFGENKVVLIPAFVICGCCTISRHFGGRKEKGFKG